MGLNAYLSPLSTPVGTQFPGTVDATLALIAQYMAVSGLSTFNGVNYGPTTPATADQDKPWFKTDASYNPIGWYGWNGAAWTAIPTIILSGNTASRPNPPNNYQLYFDTDINCLLIYERSSWRTVDGSPGDVKFVKAATLSAALTANPGWIQDPDSPGRVIGAAGQGSGLTNRAYGEVDGEEAHTLVKAELPTDAVSLKTGWDVFPGQFQNGPQAPGVQPITTGLGTTNATGPMGSGNAHNNIQPTIFYWCLVKE